VSVANGHTSRRIGHREQALSAGGSPLKRSEARALIGVALLLAATSPALAAPALGRIGGDLSSDHSMHSPRGALNLSMPVLDGPMHRPQRFEASSHVSGRLQDWSVHTGPIDANDEERSRVAFAIQWQDDPPFVSPKVASLARNFRHDGLPVVHLWQSGRNLLAIGLNPHGKPAIYFTQQRPR
jgi:hypothetical protein